MGNHTFFARNASQNKICSRARTTRSPIICKFIVAILIQKNVYQFQPLKSQKKYKTPKQDAYFNNFDLNIVPGTNKVLIHAKHLSDMPHAALSPKQCPQLSITLNNQLFGIKLVCVYMSHILNTIREKNSRTSFLTSVRCLCTAQHSNRRWPPPWPPRRPRRRRPGAAVRKSRSSRMLRRWRAVPAAAAGGGDGGGRRGGRRPPRRTGGWRRRPRPRPPTDARRR